MMRIAPPHTAQVWMSMPNTRLRRCAQVIAAGRSAGVLWSVWAAAWPVAPLPRLGLGHLRAVRAVGGEHAVEAGEIDARFGHQRGQSCDEIQRLEEHMRGAVRVGRLQLVAYQAARGERQALLRERRAADVAAQPLELAALIGPRRHAGVHTEAADLAWRLRESLIAGGQALQREHLAPGARPHRDALGDRVRQQRLHRLVVEGELGKARALRIAFEQALAFQKAAHAAGDAPRHSGELGACGCLHPAQRQ